MLRKNLFLFSLLLIFSSAKAQFAANALDFDGTNDFVVSSTMPALFSSPATNDFTIEAWVNPRGSLFARILFAQPSTTNFVSLGTSTGNVIYFYVIVNSTTYSVATSAGIPQNQWTHVAARWTAATHATEVFFNGVLQAGAAGGGSSTGTSGLMTLGTRPGGGTQYFNGALDEVRVWNVARTTCQILNNMNNDITGVQPDLVLNYNFNQGVAAGNNTGTTTLPDISGNSYNGTLTNFALTGTGSNWITSGATLTTSGNPLAAFTSSATASVCYNTGFTFPDGSVQNNITSQTIQVSTLQTTAGCDSVITTTVNVNPVYSINQSAAVCTGNSYTFPDGSTQNNITAQVIYTSSLTTVSGCDSTIITTLNVNPVYSVNEIFSVCSGNSYTFPDGNVQNNITSQILHTSMLQTTAGCDSVVNTTVNVNPTFAISQSDSVCSGSSYTFPDGSTTNNISSAMSHTNMLSTTMGCDSIITSNISVIQVNSSVTQSGDTLTATGNGSYQWTDCNTGFAIGGATSASFTPVMGGTYACVITMNGCADTSNCFLLPLSNHELNPDAFLVSVYPNPVNDILYIQFDKNITGSATLLEVSGAVVRTSEFTGSNAILDMTGIAKGIYWLNITSPDASVMKRVVKE